MVKNDLLNLLVPAKINMNLKTAMSPPPNTHTHAAAAVHAGSIISSVRGLFYHVPLFWPGSFLAAACLLVSNQAWEFIVN